mmetsp:Transcript_11176/g.22262  ORF Transcript_11176/g.22262 Transcript_11176/m.22262 type:complete len:141 (+) Transcript_11176:282-704(+)
MLGMSEGGLLSSRFVVDRKDMTWMIEAQKYEQEIIVLLYVSFDALGLKATNVLATQGPFGYFEGHLNPASDIGSMVFDQSGTSYTSPGRVYNFSPHQGIVSWELAPKSKPLDWVSFASFLCDTRQKRFAYLLGINQPNRF